MRHLIVLPGNNVRNREWGILLRDHYDGYFDSSYLQMYGHWESGGNMNMVEEEQTLRTHINSLVADTEIVVLAKSAGSILCLGAVQAGFLCPRHCVFFGLPFEWAITDVFAGNWEAIDNFSIPAIAFHNTHDPTATYVYTEKIIREHMNSVSLVATEGSDHEYVDVSLYDTYILPELDR